MFASRPNNTLVHLHVSETDLLRQLYVLPSEVEDADQHFLSHAVYSILTPGQPFPAPTLKRQEPGRVASGEQLVGLDLGKKFTAKANIELRSVSFEANDLTLSAPWDL